MCDCGCHPAREPQSSPDDAEEEVFVIRDDLAAGCTGNREDDHQCCQENGEGCCHKGGQVCCMESWEVCYREGGEISYEEGGEVCFREIGEVCCREGREKCCREAGDRSLRREGKLVKPLEGSSVEDLVTVENVQIEENKNLSERGECLCPSLHNHLREWQEKRTVRGVTMGYLWGDQLKPGLRSGTSNVQKSQTQEAKELDVQEKVIKRSYDVVKYLFEGLGEVYGPEDFEMIQHIRNVLDLEETLKVIKEKGSAGAAHRLKEQFLKSARYIDPDITDRCDRTEMRYQYQECLRKLSDISKRKDTEQLKSMEVIVLMMDTDSKRFQVCEIVMDVICQAAAMKSVESVVESWISVLEHHSNKSRDFKSESIEAEMQVAINGPKLQHCEKVVEESMRAYWSNMKRKKLQQGHFIRRSNQINQYMVSKAVDNIRKEPPNSKIMM